MNESTKITDVQCVAAMREHAAQMGESFDALWSSTDSATRETLLSEWRAILECAWLAGRPSVSAEPSPARKQLDAIMATIPEQQCSHGVAFASAEVCAKCVASDEFDPLNVLNFCEGAIRDAIGLEDGLDGRAGESVLYMIRVARLHAASPALSAEQGDKP